MPRANCRPILAVGLILALMLHLGCRSQDETAAPSPAGGNSVAKSKAQDPPKAPPSKKLFADWPTPQGAILFSGEQLGYLEPCGCTEGQIGGLLRRHVLAEHIRDGQKWPLALVDLGSLVKDPASSRGGPDQAKLKFGVALRALATMNYDALALSPDDLKVGVDEAVGQFLNLPGDRLKIVAANVVAAGLESKIVPSVKINAGGATIGVTAVADPERLKALRDPSLDLLTIKPIEESLPAVLADLQKDTKTQVLLVQGPPELAKALAQKHPEFDLVVGTSPYADPPEDAERLNEGKTLLIHVGQRGKHVGVVGIYDDPATPYRYQRVTLGTRFDGPATPMKQVIENEYRELLKSMAVVENFPRHDNPKGTRGSRYVGADTCKTCHPNTFARWSSTKHALAFESLLHDPKPNVIYDAECVTCHATGFEYNSGWVSPEKTAYLKGNQCENCHGPASSHAARPDDPGFRSALKITAEQADNTRLCLSCHDEDNSPHFDFAKYWGQVVHKDLDIYDDPKVHQAASLPPDGR